MAPKEEILKKLITQINPEFPWLYVNKMDYFLYLMKPISDPSQELQVQKKYLVSIGRNSHGNRKLYSGDCCTPEGIYQITSILSLDDPTESVTYQELARLNQIYFKKSDGYYLFGKPAQDLGENIYGPRFFRINYPNEADHLRYKKALKNGTIPLGEDGQPVGIGFGIAIHGTNDPASLGHKFSRGCIKMCNDEILELSSFIKIGTPVIIIGKDLEDEYRT